MMYRAATAKRTARRAPAITMGTAWPVGELDGFPRFEATFALGSCFLTFGAFDDEPVAEETCLGASLEEAATASVAVRTEV